MARPVITEPGVYSPTQLPEDAYHADPVPGGSLSQSGAKTLLKEGGPALFAWQRANPKPPSKAMELGSAAHQLVLGTGVELVEVKADDYYTKAAKQARDEARKAGNVPLLTKELAVVNAMAAELRKHEWAQWLLTQPGRPEMSAFWQDPDYKVWRRLRWDFMPEPDPARRPVIPDYKTAASAGPKAFAKALADFGYHHQGDWYPAGYAAMFGDRIGDYPVMAFIVQEKEPPYRVAVYQLHPDALKLGRKRNEKALAIYRECTENDDWPGYEPGPQVLDLPYWAYGEED